MSEELQERVRAFLRKPHDPMPVVSELLPHYAEKGSLPSDEDLRELVGVCADELEAVIPDKPVDEQEVLAECVSILRDIMYEARETDPVPKGVLARFMAIFKGR